ncbi:hypothetical protein BRADI_1g75067v3 [Brachypodium distachyon]|uniref:Secreted protein n=1 Tax=Brachypodium distachyon TaxID=15368 RepID=A0A2K2DV83_BRADI|nr:hypothetical protein BRADI_1g75067v3 [Brachypodium distachyon]
MATRLLITCSLLARMEHGAESEIDTNLSYMYLLPQVQLAYMVLLDGGLARRPCLTGRMMPCAPSSWTPRLEIESSRPCGWHGLYTPTSSSTPIRPSRLGAALPSMKWPKPCSRLTMALHIELLIFIFQVLDTHRHHPLRPELAAVPRWHGRTHRCRQCLRQLVRLRCQHAHSSSC